MATRWPVPSGDARRRRPTADSGPHEAARGRVGAARYPRSPPRVGGIVDRPDLDAAARGCVICDAAASRSRESDEHGLTRDAVLRRGVAAAAAAAVLGGGPLAQAAGAHGGGGRPHEQRGRRVLVQPSWVLTV